MDLDDLMKDPYYQKIYADSADMGIKFMRSLESDESDPEKYHDAIIDFMACLVIMGYEKGRADKKAKTKPMTFAHMHTEPRDIE